MEKSMILLSVLVLVWTPLGQSGQGFQKCQAPDFCNLNPSDGSEGFSCLAYIPQFFYNATSQDCEEFIYGGCGGNNNRFSSKKKCMETCSPCSNLAREMTPLTFGAQPYVLPLSDIDNACNQPQEPGPCVAYLPRYFYNATSMKCELFTYGGCKGNRNRFESLAKCQMLCHAVPEFNATEVCNLTPETGPCKAAFHRLYYNPESQRCEPFLYGGCGGNDNRFKSIKECMRLCHPEGSDVITPLVRPVERRSGPVCTLPPKTGPCRANLPRYFYNSTSHECELFTYGGCGGNSNKFVSARECKLICHQKTQEPTETPGTDSTGPCLLPPKTGPCMGLIPRYYYNPDTQKCEEFMYGGCRGNRNNFVGEEECMKTCKKD